MSRTTVLSVLFFLLMAGTADAQYGDLLRMEPGKRNIHLQGLIFAGSNTFTNKHYLDFRNGGYISSAVIDDVVKTLNSKNIIGGYITTAISWMEYVNHFAGIDSVYLFVSAGYHQLQELEIAENAALVALKGNLPFEGDTLSIAPLHYHLLKYHQCKFGMMHTNRSERGVFYAGFSVGINLGLQQMKLDVGKASIYTAPFGEYISLHHRMSFSRSAHQDFSPSRIQGVGPALEFFYTWIPVKGPALSLSFSQLGFIVWNKKSYSYLRDTTILYEGMLVDNIFNMGDDWEQGISNDTLDKLFNRYGHPHRHYTSLPLTVQLAVRQKMRTLPLSVRGEFLYRHETRMKPYFALSLEWQAFKQTEIIPVVAVGGYSQFSTGLLFHTCVLRSNWWLEFGSNALWPALSSADGMNIHLYAGLMYRSQPKKTIETLK